MCHPAPRRPGVPASGTWHAAGLRKFGICKIRGKALKDKKSNNKIGKMLQRRKEREKAKYTSVRIYRRKLKWS